MLNRCNQTEPVTYTVCLYGMYKHMAGISWYLQIFAVSFSVYIHRFVGIGSVSSERVKSNKTVSTYTAVTTRAAKDMMLQVSRHTDVLRATLSFKQNHLEFSCLQHNRQFERMSYSISTLNNTKR